MGIHSSPVSKEQIARARKWKAAWDKKTGSTFYYHRITRESQWHKPRGFDEARREIKAEKEDAKFLNVICYENNIVHNSSSSTAVTIAGDIVRDVANPSTLFQYLQLKYWAAALNHVRKKPRDARIWISRGLDGNHSLNSASASANWKVLPLHASIILGAPSSLIIQILDAYPDAARRKDLNGSLPLHLASCSLSTYVNGEQVFEVLLSAYPEARGVEDRNGHTPVKILHHTQMWRDNQTKQNWFRILNILETETENEGIEAQLEILPEGEDGGAKGYGVSSGTDSDLSGQIPEILEFPTTMDAYSSSLENPSSLWCASSSESVASREPREEETLRETEEANETISNIDVLDDLLKAHSMISKDGCSVVTEKVTAQCTVATEIRSDIVSSSASMEEPSHIHMLASTESSESSSSTVSSIKISSQLEHTICPRQEEQEQPAKETQQRHLPSSPPEDSDVTATSRAKSFLQSKLVNFKFRRSRSTPPPPAASSGSIVHSQPVTTEVCLPSPPRKENADPNVDVSYSSLYDTMMTSKTFPPYPTDRTTIPTIEEDDVPPFTTKPGEQKQSLVEEGGISKDKYRYTNNNSNNDSNTIPLRKTPSEIAANTNARRGLDKMTYALDCQRSYPKSRPECDAILHTRSCNDSSPRMKDVDDPYYGCMLTANKTFPQHSSYQITPRIDKYVPFGKLRSELVGDIGSTDKREEYSDEHLSTLSRASTLDGNDQNDDKIGDAELWIRTVDEMTRKPFYYHRETKEIRWDESLGFADTLKGNNANALFDEDTTTTSPTSILPLAGSPEKTWRRDKYLNTPSSEEDIESPTVLFLYMHRGDWSNSLLRITEYPTEASVWIWRKTRGYFLWKLLPLHASIVLGAPSYLILEILTAYPEAARERDLNGSLPVHLAASRIETHEDGESVINHLMRAFPDSIAIRDGKGRTATEIVEKHGMTIETNESFPIDHGDDYMLGYSRTTSTRRSLSEDLIFTESEIEPCGNNQSFTMETGYTAFDSCEDYSAPCSIEEDFENIKSGFIRITFND